MVLSLWKVTLNARRLAPYGLALALSVWLASTEGGANAVAQASIDITSRSVQTFYQDGTPHTDWTGRLRTTYQPGESSLPIGMYYTEPCRVANTFEWPAFDDETHPLWDAFQDAGTYEIFIWLGTAPQLGDWLGFHQAVPATEDPTQSAIIDRLPAGTDLFYQVWPNPHMDFLFGPDSIPALGGGVLNLECPTSDQDDPNVVQTLSDGGFNLAIMPASQPLHHPQLYIDLKNEAGVQEFEIVANGAHGLLQKSFPEQLFAPEPEGQGYSQHPDVFGWQLEDEPLARAATDEPTCDEGNMKDALERLAQKYDDHKDITDQVIFHVEGGLDYFLRVTPPCDPGILWDQMVRIGDAANQDLYIDKGRRTGPIDSLKPIADSMTRQTEAVDEADPSWFTVQAVSVENQGFRSDEETRATVYTAIVHGATGIWYYGWDGFGMRDAYDGLVGVRPTIPESYPEQTSSFVASQTTIDGGQLAWQGIVELNAELAQLEPVILRPTDTELYRVFVSADPHNRAPIRTMLKSEGNQHHLIAVNMDDAAIDAHFVFEHGLASADVVFEGRQATITGSDNTVLADHFEPFDVHIYDLAVGDEDSDGFDNFADNCLSNPEEDQTDRDGDGLGVPCDPDDSLVDTDQDGCSDREELGPEEVLGGRRDPANAWDFYDTPGAANARDQSITLFDDVFAVVFRFGANDGGGSDPINRDSDPLSPPLAIPAYHPSFDRSSAAPGDDPWDLGPPDGEISLFADIFGVFAQVGHNCLAPP